MEKTTAKDFRIIKGILVITDEARKEYGVRGYKFKYKDYTDFYKLLDINTFDIAIRMIGDHEYDIYIDDEALLKEPLLPASIQVLNKKDGDEIVEFIYGNAFICKHDENGEIISLTDEELNEIMSYSFLDRVEAHCDFGGDD